MNSDLWFLRPPFCCGRIDVTTQSTCSFFFTVNKDLLKTSATFEQYSKTSKPRFKLEQLSEMGWTATKISASRHRETRSFVHKDTQVSGQAYRPQKLN